MQSVSKLPQLKSTRILVRVDYNVPLKGSRIVDSRRIDASLVTVRMILKKGGTPVLLAHLGEGGESLRPVATYLSKLFPKVVFVTHDLTDPRIIEILDQVPKGTVVLLENIRRYEGETTNASVFAKALAKLGTYYVNDAFSVSHRAHASVIGVPRYMPAYAGLQLLAELKALKGVLENKKHPFLFMLGGAKFATKIPLLKQFLTKADKLIITGAILNNFYQVAGFEVGDSVVESGYDAIITKLLKNPKVLLPIDTIVVRAGKKLVLTPAEIAPGDVIVDIGPQSIALIEQEVSKAKLVVWNGPTGWYEKKFDKGTAAVARAIVSSKAHAVIGGGDTGAVIEKVIDKVESKRIFVSTGGGATLEYLSKGTLPGIKALK